MKKWIASLVAASLTCSVAVAEKSGFIVDTIIATVDDKPITLMELGKRLSPPRTLTVSQASTDPEARETLNGLIMERMLAAEAERRNIKVSDDDVTHYIDEVKKKNNLSDEALAKAIQGDHKTMAEYKEQIRMDILKSKISANYIRSSAAVTDEEIDTFIKQGMSSSSGSESGNKVHIRQIMLSPTKYTADEARVLSEKIHSELVSGVAFEALAERYSDDRAHEGGDMGLIAESDLSPDIFDAILHLKDGEVSFLVSAPQGYFLYQMVERIKSEENSSEDDNDEKPQVSDTLRAQVRQKLEQEKMQAKMISFIETELPKMHTVEKRI